MDLESLIFRVERLAEILNHLVDSAYGDLKPMSEAIGAVGMATAVERDFSMIFFVTSELSSASRDLYPAFEEAQKESRP